MSANPLISAADDVVVLTRDQALDDQVLAAFERSSDLNQYTSESLEATQEWVVLIGVGSDVQTFSDETGVNIAGATGIIPDTYVVTPGENSVGAMIEALSASDDVDYFYPLLSRTLSLQSVPNDPYLQYQWHLINIGQEVGSPDFSPFYGTPGEDVNAKEAWESGYTGNGVQIAIVDNGVLSSHPDLIGNYRSDLELEFAGFVSQDHGTAVAGLAGGTGNNGIGTTGTAYEADITSINLLEAFAFSDFTVAQSLVHEFQEIDIYNHSWGFVGATQRTYTDLGPLSTTALRNSVFFGRGGLGNIHVKSSGNDGGDTSSQYSGFANSRYTITVSGVDEQGQLVGYAEGGANVLVSAPTGTNPSAIVRDSNLGSGIWTTDLVGNAGYNEEAVNGIEIDFDYFLDTDYASRFNGTSASAPIVSGVIALMLEANPNLSYRDVQSILVLSARQNDPSDLGWITNAREQQYDPIRSSGPEGVYSLPNSVWPGFPVFVGTPEYVIDPFQDQFTNGAGFTVNQGTGLYDDPGFGHGVVDAGLAVELATNWTTVGPQTSEYTWSTGNLALGKIWGAVESNEETGKFLIPGGLRGDGDVEDQFTEFFNEWGKLGQDPADEPPPPFQDDDGPIVPIPINNRDFGAFFFNPGEIPGNVLNGGQPGVNIPAPSGMSVEWIEVELDFSGTNPEDLNYLRVVLVSPDGTQSELKTFGRPVARPIDHYAGFDGLFGTPAGDLGTTSMVFTTNRHWGERTEPLYRVGEYIDKTDLDGDGDFQELISRIVIDNYYTPPIVDPTDPEADPIEFPDNPVPVFDDWRLVFENYGGNLIEIDGFEVAFHGADVAGTGRIQGAIGVDDDGNGFFSDLTATEDNFKRYIPGSPNIFEDVANRIPLSEFEQESWASGVIVYADLDHNEMRDPTDPHFQIGADGNYYFDLLAGQTYDLRIDLDSLENAGLNTMANRQMLNNEDMVFVSVSVDAVGQRVLGISFEDESDPLYFVDLNIKGNTDLNFVFDPPSEAPETIDLSGTIYADLDSNGQRDGADFAMANVDVFVDINKNGVYTAGVDYLATTNANGEYTFRSGENGIPATTPSDFYIVHVLPGTTGPFGVPTEPVPPTSAEVGEYGLFFEYGVPTIPGDAGYIVEDLVFGFGPGLGSGGGSSVGTISGVVFADVNANGVQDTGDDGLQNAANVYLDINQDNVRGLYYDPIADEDVPEPVVTPDFNGAYAFSSLLPDTYDVRLEFSTSQYDQTTPSGFLNPDGTRVNEDDWEYTITVTANSITAGMDFGLYNKAVLDYGDLPDIYGTTSASGGPTHVVFGDLYLGETPTDAEVDAPLQLDGSGDDVTGSPDEDGIAFSTLFNGLTPSTTLTATVHANTDGGYLQGWIDFDADGVFQASERVFDDVLLLAGDTVFEIPVPANLTAGGGTVYARFRYGEQGIDSPVGAAIKGEVEDYALPVVSNAVDPGGQLENGPDFDDDGDIDGFDFLSWQLGFGSVGAVVASDGDSDNDNDVDSNDMNDWEAGFGTVVAGAATVAGDNEEMGSPAGVVEENSEGTEPPALVYSPAAEPSGTNNNGGASTLGLSSTDGQRVLPITEPVFVSQDSTSDRRIEKHLGRSARDTASLAQAFHSLREGRFAKLDQISDKVFESRSSETSFDQSIDVEDLGFAVRDRVLDHLFAKRRDSLEDRLERIQEREFEIDDAFAAALGEDVDWRFS